MPNATLPGDVHVNAALSGVARAYFQNPAGFIADQVFPAVPVAKQTDFFYRYNRADWNRNSMRRRAPRTESAVAGFGTDRDTYAAEVWSLAYDIADETRANADSFWNLDRDATLFLMMKARISREVNMPNRLTLGAQVYDTLLDHPDIIDRIKYGQANVGQPAIVNRTTLAALFEVDSVLVAEAIQNTAAENATAGAAADESTASIVGNHALLSYAPPAPSVLLPSAGYTGFIFLDIAASGSGFLLSQ
jgi:hypothetical protein